MFSYFALENMFMMLHNELLLYVYMQLWMVPVTISTLQIKKRQKKKKKKKRNKMPNSVVGLMRDMHDKS